MQMRRLFLYFKIFELAKNMNKKSLIFGVLVNFIWLLGIYLFSRSNGYTLPTSLNELGDFLAGIFAPIAFFWLILGYIQQGKQLDQNTRALEQQEIALQLQINEMKESVKQQKELVEIQKQQYVDSSNSVAPYFGFNDLKIHCFGCGSINGVEQDPDYELLFKLSNSGKEVRDIQFIDTDGKTFYALQRINSNEVLDISIPLSDLSMEWVGDNLISRICIKYKNLFGRAGENQFLLEINYEKDWEIDNPLKINFEFLS